MLPWRRRIRNISRFDFMPFGGVRELIGDPLGWIPLVLLFPLWIPAAAVGVVSLLELLLEVVVLPFALLYRKVRGAWPVIVYDDGRLLTRLDAPGRETARDWTKRMRDEIVRPGVGSRTPTARSTPEREDEAIAALTIRTTRLDLLPLQVEHADEMAVVLSDPALHTFVGGSPDTAADLRSRYQQLVAGSPDPDVAWLNWVIWLRDEACMSGTVQATISPSAHGTIAEIAWVVGTPWQGRGIASEAARGLVDWLCQQSVETVVAHIHPEHHASGAVAAAAGLAPTDEWNDGEVRWRRHLRGPAS